MQNDDVDDLLRLAMKTLDDQMPPGYFEGLPSRTLARLEDSSMQTTSGTSGSSELPAAASGPLAVTKTVQASPPPVSDGTPARDEDSGLHDIRNLASSARMRLSSRRISTTPPIDEDILASSSAGWKAVALPEPAKMISLPELSAAEVKRAEKVEKASRKSRPSGEMKVEAPVVDRIASQSSPSMPSMPVGATAIAEAPLHLDEPMPVAKAPATVTPLIGARIAGAKSKSNKSRNVILGVGGTGLAAAAAFVIYMQTTNTKDKAAESAPAAAARSEGAAEKTMAPAPAEPARPTVQAIAIDDPKDKADTAAAGSGAAVEPEVQVDAKPADDPAPTKPSPKIKKPDAKTKAPGKTIIEVPGPDASKKPSKVEKIEKPKSEKGKDGEPDFNELLKEAGVDANKPQKPKLDKTSLTPADFRNGMGAVRGRAEACYKGEQGNVNVKVFIAPSGQVSRVQVSGSFAGTPAGACVEAAVKGATFPAWDGTAQSYNYSFLLSEK